jgi:O-antigen/teichoic acid export membrane protein
VLEKISSTVSRKIAFNTLAQVAEKVVNLVFGLIIAGLIARSLGKAGYGDYSLARNFMLLFTLGVDFGLNAIVVREIVHRKDVGQRYLNNLVSLRLFLSALFVFLGLLLLFFTPYSQEVEQAALIALLILFPWGLRSALNALFQAKLRYDFSAVACIIGQAVNLVLIIAGVTGGLGLPFLVSAGLVGGLVSVFFALIWAGKIGLEFRPRGDWELWRRLLVAALPLGLMLIFAQVVAKADLFLLSLLPLPGGFGLGSQETVGIYSLAYQIFQNAVIIPTFFMNAFFPVMVVDYKENWERLLRRLKKAAVLLFAVSVLGMIVGLLFAPWIISVIAGEGFDQAAIALRILLLGLPLFYLTSPLQWFLVTIGKERVLPFVYGLAVVINITLNLAFIPDFSYWASAIIVLVTEFVVFVLLALLARRYSVASAE